MAMSSLFRLLTALEHERLDNFGRTIRLKRNCESHGVDMVSSLLYGSILSCLSRQIAGKVPLAFSVAHFSCRKSELESNRPTATTKYYNGGCSNPLLLRQFTLTSGKGVRSPPDAVRRISPFFYGDTYS